MRDDWMSERESKVFELRSEKPRPEVATKKFNVFAELGVRLRPMTYAVD
jgi:hypothetical protein